MLCSKSVGDDSTCRGGLTLGNLLGSTVTSDSSSTGYSGVGIQWSASITSLRLVKGDGNTTQFGTAAAGTSATLSCPPGMLVAGFTGVTTYRAVTKTGSLLQLGLLCRQGEWFLSSWGSFVAQVSHCCSSCLEADLLPALAGRGIGGGREGRQAEDGQSGMQGK